MYQNKDKNRNLNAITAEAIRQQPTKLEITLRPKCFLHNIKFTRRNLTD